MGVVSSNRFDCILLSILYMFKPSCRPMLKPPSLGPPEFPLKPGHAARAGGTQGFDSEPC